MQLPWFNACKFPEMIKYAIDYFFLSLTQNSLIRARLTNHKLDTVVEPQISSLVRQTSFKSYRGVVGFNRKES